ncbi:MAG TPA: hypothetical protein VNA13_05180 [Xanthomonadales bacterium]|nr:hypothetical protein [Xanthomonadales bacterium]
MNEIEELKKEVESLKARNRRVETNKAWETSLTRKLILVCLTYATAGATLRTLNNSSPWTNALIPSIGFFLSTLTLPILRDLWQKYIYKK